jgi:hypothetical protein
MMMMSRAWKESYSLTGETSFMPSVILMHAAKANQSIIPSPSSSLSSHPPHPSPFTELHQSRTAGISFLVSHAFAH